MTHSLTLADLAQFTCTDQWYRHGLVRNVLFTDGARYLAEKGGAFWLLDEIALAQKFEPAVKPLDFQCWTLTVHANASALLACEDGNGHRVHAKTIPWTDFPLSKVSLWVECDGEHRVILLPSEH